MAKKGLSTLEKSLILLFVIMTGACVGLVVVYFTEDNTASPGAEGEWTAIRTQDYCAKALSYRLHKNRFSCLYSIFQ